MIQQRGENMKKAKKTDTKKCRPDMERCKAELARCRPVADSCKGGGIYCLGFIGSAVYYISTATGFWDGVLGVLKALVWPAFLVFHLFKFLGM